MPSRNPTFYYRNKHLFEKERASYYQHKAKEVIPGACRLFRLLPAARPFLLSAVCSAGRVLPGVCARRKGSKTVLRGPQKLAIFSGWGLRAISWIGLDGQPGSLPVPKA